MHIAKQVTFVRHHQQEELLTAEESPVVGFAELMLSDADVDKTFQIIFAKGNSKPEQNHETETSLVQSIEERERHNEGRYLDETRSQIFVYV